MNYNELYVEPNLFWPANDEACGPHKVPAQHQTNKADAPGQIVNPVPEHLVYKPQTAKAYKPTHGGYPGYPF